MSVAPSLFTRGARIGLSPWSAETMGAEACAILEARAAALDVVVSTFKRRDNGWMVRVRKDRQTTSLVGYGPLVAVIDGALDDFESLAAA